ncbi:serine hydrolase domain-containing protein [Anaerobacillus alkaliphilus]|uniref:serine hydrolase domain-containing protein n=1 Tax=Anaerobacillus alkaliphilus TaxID=1548597 RepID=UPI001375B9B1|nr:serine hydrolase [Anaerobacillus alkaliphilus]
MNIKKKLFVALGIIGIGCIVLIGYSALRFSPEYMLRIIKYGNSDINDYGIFPARKINKAEEPFYYRKTEQINGDEFVISYQYGNQEKVEALNTLLEKSGTTAFIVIANDQLVYEGYFNDYDRNSINTSFSAAKSFVSLLIGLAIDDGSIQSVHEPITNYITELAGTDFELITIEDLLLMRSPISYKEGKFWFGDDAKTYYMPDLRELAMKRTKLAEGTDGNFHYNNYHPLLLGIILERSTGKAVAAYMEEKLWKRIGTEYGASWSLDSEQTGFEKMESGINARAIDFAKVGSLILQDGVWEGEEIISKQWLQKSTIVETPLNHEEYQNSFLADRNTGYGYMWYSVSNDENYDVYALGKYSQIIYVSQKYKTVVVRNGFGNGEVDWWPDVIRNLIEQLHVQ